MAEAGEKQLARTVTNDQRDVARKIIQDIEVELERCANGDPSIALAASLLAGDFSLSQSDETPEPPTP